MNTPATGNSSWRREDDGAGSNTGGWTSPTSGTYSPASSAGSHSARFHSYYASSSSTGSLDLYVNFGTAGTKNISYSYINPTGSDVIVCQISTDGGTTFTTLDAPPAVASAWTTRTTSTTAVSSTAILRFRTTSDFGDDDIGLDNINVALLPACTAPSAPTAASYITTPTGATVTFTPPGTAPTGYILVRSTGALVGGPTTGQAITTGTAVGSNGTIVGVGTSSPISSSVALTPNSNYTMTLFAYNGGSSCSGGPVFSSAVTNTITTCPNAPGTPFAGTITSSSITVSWAAPAAGGGAYSSYTYLLNVYVDAALTTAASGYPPSGTTVTTPYTITGLSAGTTYYYTITAVTPACASVASASGNAATLAIPCSGTPSAGVVNATGSPVISTGTFTLSITGASVESGLTYQWQSSACQDTWTDIGGATGATLATTETAGIFYRRITTCTSAGASAPSTTVFVPRISAAYCTSLYSTGCAAYSDYFSTLTLTGACGTALTDPGNTCPGGSYDDRTSSTPVKMYPGGTYSGLAATPETDGGDWMLIWIDFNDNGVFTDAGEQVIASPLHMAIASSAYSITIPAVGSGGSSYGLHRMRIREVWKGSTYSAFTSCSSETWGQTRDFVVQIVPNPSLSSNSPVCAGGTLTLTATPAVTCGAIYTWSGPSSYSSSTVNANTVSPSLVAGIYSVNISVNGVTSCSTPGTTTVVVNPLPATTTASGAGTFCGSTAITASNGGDGTMYFQGTTSGGTSTATASASQVVTATGTYYFRARSAAGCWGPQGSVAVVINPVPTAAPTNNGYICNGGTVTLTANPSATASVFTWSGVGLSSASATNPTATPTSTSIYTLTVSDGSGNPGCSPTTQYTTTVSVNPTPAASPTNNGYICNGGTVTLTANPSGGATAFLWSGSSLSSAGIANPTATPASTTTYSLTVSDGTSRPGCTPTTIYTTTVSVNPTPAAAPANDGPICNGGTVNLTANGSGGASAFVWSGSSLSSGSVANPSATPSATSVYSLTVSDGSSRPGCAPTTIYTTSVTVNSAPTAAPTNNGYICQGGTVTLTANPGGSTNTYAWSGPGLSSGTAQNPTATPTSTSTYSLTVTNGTSAAGCTSTLYTTTVSVNPTPTAAPTNDGPICNGGTVNLAANPSGGASVFTWSGSGLSSTSVATPSATPSSASVYSLMVSDGSGRPGCSPTAVYTTSVTVNSTPTASPINNGYICAGGAVTLTANPGGSTNTYAWSGPNLSSSTAQNPTATPTVTSTYSLTVTNGTSASGCNPSILYTTTVSVNPTPVASPVNNGYICNGGTVTLTANPAGGATVFAWTGPSLSSASAGNPTATPTSTAVYSLTVSDGSTQPGCSPSTIYTTAVSVNPTPAAAPTNDGPICNGGTVNLAANPSGGASVFTWSGSSLSSTSVATPSASPSSTSVFSLTVSDGSGRSGCSPSTIYTTSVTVNSTPTAAPTNNGYICIGGAATLAANPGGSTSTYSWSGPNLSSFTAQNPTASPTVTSTYSLTVANGTSASGCNPSTLYTTTVSVNPTPVASPVNNGYICNGGTVNFTANPAGGATAFTWSGSGLSSASAENPTATPTSTSVYSLAVSDGSSQPGCSPSAIFTTTVSVNPTPAAAPANNGYICEGGTVTLNANPSGGAAVFTWAGTNLSSASAQDPTATPTSTTVYSLTVTDGSGRSGCSPSTLYTTTVSVNPTPVATPTNNSPICVGGTVVLTANPAGGANTYAWSGSSLSSASSANPTATPTSTTVYSLTVSDGSGRPGCSPATVYTTSVTVNVAPSLTSVTNSGPICNGTTLNLSAIGAANVTDLSWSGPVAITTATSATASVPAATTAATGTYSVTVNNATGPGCSITYTTSATVNELPTVANITPATTNMCVGTPLTLNAGAVTGTGFPVYNWSGPNGYAATTTVSNVVLTPTTTAASGIYTLFVTYPGGGCNSTPVTSASVTVNNLPTVTSISVSPSAICAENPITLTGAGALGNGALVSYNWSGPNGYSSTTATAVQVYTVPDALAGGVYSLSVTYTGTGCTSGSVVSGILTVNPLPIAYTITGGGFYCSGGTGVHIGLDGSDGGVNYQLYNGSTAVGSPVAGTGSAIDFGLQTAGGAYTISATNATTGCGKAMNGSTTVSVGSVPTVYTMTGGGGYCSGGIGVHIGLSNSNSSVSYQLYLDGVADGALVLGTGTALDFGLKIAPGTYTIIANPGAACAIAMSGSASVFINPLPTVYNVTGGGTYCSGGTGVHIGLDWSVNGINYGLYNGSTLVSTAAGANSGLDFGFLTAGGSYTVLATNATTGCTRNMTGSATVVVNPLPTAYNVTGGGSYCSGGTGVAVGLSNSETGINYQLYNGTSTVGGPLAGISAAISFGSQTGVGTYTVLATNTTTSCARSMSGNAIIGTNPLPTVFSVTGGGSYCIGGSGFNVGLGGSVVGTNYQLYRGSSAIGAPVVGTGAALDFGVQAIAGTYTVSATTTSTGCSGGMSGNATIVVNPLPTVFAVTGGGSACLGSGVAVGLAGSQLNVNYQLYNGGSVAGSPVAGTGSAISFGSQPSAGTYTVVATNVATTCSSNMSGSATVVINPLPTVYSVTGGGSYCAGSAGVTVGLGNSASGINYQLYYGSAPVGAPVAGTGGAISFGMQTSAGTYTVAATNSSTTCSNGMSGNATISINPLPTVYTVTGGGSYCTGGVGVHVGLIASASGTNYQLYNNATPVGSPVAGTGAALDFGFQTTAGTYSVVGTNASTACSAAMSGTVPVIVNPLPVVQNVTGGGNYCAGGAGIHVGLDYGVSGTNYQLYNGSTPVGSPVPGGNTSIDFGAMIPGGTYTVQAISATTTCTRNMSGSAVVVVNPLPVAYTVTGGGIYCSGGTGLAVGLGNSEAGVNYQLYRGATPVGSPLVGSNSAISFGLQTSAGSYSVAAVNTTTACTNNMAGNATIVINPAPTVYNMTGGGGYCVGGTAPHVGLAGSNTGINYQLYNGASTVGGIVAGTGSALDFGVQSTAGTYTVLATNASTSCQGAMSGDATVVINSLPVAYNVTGGGTYCIGGTGVNVGLSNSATGVNYQLYRGATAVGSPVAGTGSTIGFGLQTPTGTYTVFATNPTTGCTQNMSGSVSISTNPVPTAYTVLGSGSYCAGGAGLHVTLMNSTPFVNYQLYRGSTAIGSAMVGAGASLDFGAQTIAGVYSVSATDAITGCSNNMTGTATISINPLPVVYTVSGGGTICAGAGGPHVLLSNSASGISYQLYNGATTIGGGVIGTGASLDFGVFTTAGTYTVRATDLSTACSTAMAGTAVINVNPLPTAYTVAGGGSYCSGGAGVNISLAGSQVGATYQLYNGASATGSPVAGGGSSIDFGLQTALGTYSVLATITASGCTRGMTGNATVNINPLPVVYNTTGGGSYCSGGLGVTVGLSNSQGGVNYQLYFAGVPSGSPVSGTGSPLSFGSKTLAGTYSVVATDATTGCANNMSGNATISINSLPTAFAVTGGGSYCSGGTGVTITTAGSATGVNYQLYNGSTAVGTAVAGTGSGLFFGTFTTAGTYTAVAVNPSTGCAGNMTGSATVAVNPSPMVFAVTGGGTYCAGGSGVNVGLVNSTSGINYQLYNGVASVGSPVAGTGLPLNFGLQSAGTYTVLATNSSTACTSIMAGSATVSANPLPTAFSITGGGSYCADGAGVNVGLGNSVPGVIYQLYRGSTAVGTPLSGTGASLAFGLQTAPGVYSVAATTVATGCTNNMTGAATVNVNALPAVYTVAGGGSYCSGGTGFNVSLSGSASGINYQLYRSSTLVGSAIAGSGSAIDFGFQTAAGTYTVSAVDAATGCSANMAGSGSIIVNASPNVYAVTGGGAYCSGGTGVTIGIGNSTSGISYQLYNGSTPIGTAVTGTGLSLGFGALTAAGTYSVRATNTSTTCTSDMNGTATVVVNATPFAYAVTGGGGYCAGGTGLAVGLSSSGTGVNYQLYNGSTPVSGLVAGTGLPVSFGTQTAAGTYTVYAMSATSGCNNSMSGSATIAVNALPVAQTMTGGGAYCAGGPGVNIGLTTSATGINYQLYNGATPVGLAVAGTGSSLSFGSQTAAGVYTVVATNATTSCSNSMSGSATVLISSLPAVYAVTGGGSYCNGGSGVAVGLGSSEPGVSYQLYNGSASVGSPVIGSGSALNFGSQTASGTYTVSATNGSTCSAGMSGLATVAVNALPTAYSVTGGGDYCAGGAGVNVGLNFSATGVSYRLYRDGLVVGSSIAGTNATLNFGAQTAAGTYTIMATNASTGCTSNMIGLASVVVNPLPAAFVMTGGGSYCAGGTGVNVGVNSSELGIAYTLYNGVTPVTTMSGSGSALDFGPQTTAGTYTIMASNTTTACSRTMTGSAPVAVNMPPVVQNVAGGGSYCAGGTGVNINLTASETGVIYQLYNGSSVSGSVATGTGSSLTFGTRTAAGTYSVMATNASSGCMSNMSGTVSVAINPLPTAYAVSGGGSYCAGGTGVTISLPNGDAGIDYVLYNATSSTLMNTVSGLGAPVNFGLYTAPGTYTVLATDAGTGCTRAMIGVASVAVNNLPIAYSVTGGGNYCAGGTGVDVMLNGSSAGTTYQLYNGATTIGSPMLGTGAVLSFGPKTTAGTYSVLATTTATGCANAMAGNASVAVDPTPAVFAMAGGGSYCAGGTGIAIGLTNSATGINYQLYNGGVTVGGPISGTGGVLSFGTMTAAGTYTVKATNASTGCNADMIGVAAVAINPLPAAYTVGGGGSYCAGAGGLHVSLSNSAPGISYQVYNGAALSGGAVAGSGGVLDFGFRTAAGVYTVLATDNTNGCTRPMLGNATINVNALPATYTVTGGGAYCSGSGGVNIGLGNSATGITYQLYNGSLAVGAPFTGTGSAFNFGLQTTPGTYTIKATNGTTGCVANMAGNAIVSVNPLPVMYAVAGGGSFCDGNAGVTVSLTGSQSGAAYQLYNGATAVGGLVSGTGSSISFGLQTAAGTYTVLAVNSTSTCGRGMSGSATVTVNSAPIAYAMSGGGSYCVGGAGVHVGLANSASGVYYQLYNGSSSTGIALTGTGAPIDFGLLTAAGNYSVKATNSTTGCVNNMSGTSVVAINALPVVFNVTGGGTICPGSSVNVGLSNSSLNVTYRLYQSGIAMGSALPGTGSALNFGPQTVAGTYTVLATGVTSSCTNNMSGSATVTVLPAVLPSVSFTSDAPATLCPGTLVTFIATPVNGGTAPVYQWSVNGTPSTTGSGYSYVPANGDVVAVTLTSNATCAAPTVVNATMTMTVSPAYLPVVNIGSAPGDTVCNNTDVAFTATPTYGGTAPSYEWFRNGISVGVGPTYHLTPLNGDNIYCRMTSNIACPLVPTVNSSTHVMSVLMPSVPVVAITASPGTTVAPGTTVTFNASVTGGGATPTYQWSVNGVTVVGATNAIYMTNALANGDDVTCDVMSSGPCGGLPSFNTVKMTVGNVGVAHISASAIDVTVLPNPSNGTFTVKGAIATDEIEIALEVTDMLGQTVYSGKAAVRGGKISERVQLANSLANGMYMLNIRSASGSNVYHIVLEQ